VERDERRGGKWKNKTDPEEMITQDKPVRRYKAKRNPIQCWDPLPRKIKFSPELIVGVPSVVFL
jgi:hypothetical protein